MRIGIDARMLEASSGLTGIATSLLETLRELNEIDHTNEYFLFSRKKINCDICFNKNWNLVAKDFPQGMIWYNTVLLDLLKEYRIEVFWNANHILPLRKVKGCRYIVTINDIAIFKLKGIGDYSNIIKQYFFVKRACKSAYKVIAISKATKDDLVDTLGVPSNKIVVNLLGGLRWRTADCDTRREKEILQKFGVTQRYFLYLGTLEPRKNLITLVKAFEQYRKNGYGEEELMIAGGKGWRFENTQEYIDSSVYRNDIHQIGYVSNEEKVALLKNAVAFVFPSLYEGFGIPILEAMESGVPVVTSRVSSMPEVGGELAYYIDEPTDINDLTEKMKEAATLVESEREELKSKERLWVQNFSWKKTAEGFISLVSADN